MNISSELSSGTILSRLSLAACDVLNILNAADADGVREALDRQDLRPLAQALGMEPAEIEVRLDELRSASSALMALVKNSFGGSNPPSPFFAAVLVSRTGVRTCRPLPRRSRFCRPRRGTARALRPMGSACPKLPPDHDDCDQARVRPGAGVHDRQDSKRDECDREDRAQRSQPEAQTAMAPTASRAGHSTPRHGHEGHATVDHAPSRRTGRVARQDWA